MCMARERGKGREALSVMEAPKGRKACTKTRREFYWRLEDTVFEALDQRKLSLMSNANWCRWDVESGYLKIDDNPNQTTIINCKKKKKKPKIWQQLGYQTIP